MKPQFILDTDIGNDVDDLIAIAMFCNWHKAGQVDLCAAVSSKQGKLSGEVLSWLLGYYGLEVPVGYCESGALQPKQKYLELLPKLQAVYPRVISHAVCPSKDIILKALQGAKDQSLTYIMIGNATNVAEILSDKALSDLMHQKICRIIWMAGEFEVAYPENNIRVDAKSSHIIFDNWHGVLEMLPSSVGKKVIYPGHHLIDRPEPVAQMYNDYMKRGWGRECWDPLTVLYASGIADEVFEVSSAGKIVLDDNEITQFIADTKGLHRLIDIKADHAMRAKALSYITKACML